MPTIAAIGEETLVRALVMAGVRVTPADDPAAVRSAWRALPSDVGVVILTEAAASTLADERATSVWPLVAVMA
jgi:vacuolar-type H+-ATPase subunit F/Vma7